MIAQQNNQSALLSSHSSFGLIKKKLYYPRDFDHMITILMIILKVKLKFHHICVVMIMLSLLSNFKSTWIKTHSRAIQEVPPEMQTLLRCSCFSVLNRYYSLNNVGCAIMLFNFNHFLRFPQASDTQD